MPLLFAESRAPVILMYHRIADPACDPWGLAVAPSSFDRQMRALRTHRVPLSLDEFVQRLERGTLSRLAVAVTFDDGYGDTALAAKPVLEEHAVPATVFLTTGYLGTRAEFWWDGIGRLILCGREAVTAALDIGTRSIPVQLPAVPGDGALRSRWRAWDAPRTPREHLYLDVWRELRPLDEDARRAGLNAARQLFDGAAADARDWPMTADQVKGLVAGTSIDVGAHSTTHRPLTTMPLDQRRQEIEESRARCAAIAGKPIAGFSYPHGDFDAATADLVRASGFTWACSTRGRAVDRARFDRFALPRLQAFDWTAFRLRRALNRLRTCA